MGKEVASGNPGCEHRSAPLCSLVPGELGVMSESEKIIMRKLSIDDIATAMELSTEAGWNQTPEDWRTLIELSPEGCLGIEADEVLASTATLLCYGRRLAWVGMVLTRVRFRGRGYARRLLTETL